MNKDMFRKKFLFPLCYLLVTGLAIVGGNHMIPRSTDRTATGGMAFIEPAAGAETSTAAPVPAIDESALADAPIVPALESVDAAEEPPIRISPDKPEIIHLSKDAVNVLVGSDENLRAIPDTNRTIILIPKKPGATFFKAIDADGHIIAQRHVIIGGPVGKSKYIRIRRACVNGADGCKEYSVYYCPDVCHEVNVIQDAKKGTAAAIPNDVASTPVEDQGNPNSENVTPATTTP